MGLGHVYTNSHTTNIQIKPAFKSKAQINAGVRHNKRLGKEGDKANIDKRLSYLNEEIRGATADEIYLNLCNRLTGNEYTLDNMPGKTDIKLSSGKRIRSDATLAYEIEASYPGDMIWSMLNREGQIVPVPPEKEITPENVKDYFKMPKDMQEFEEWKNATVEFLKERYGDENLLSIQVHMDEDEPHIHAIGIPIVENTNGENRLSYKEISGGPKGLADLQTDYADHVAYLGYKRGENFSSRKTNISTKEYKARLNEALSEQIPDSLDKCQDEILNLRAKNFRLEQEMSQTMKSAKLIQNLRKGMDELREEVKRLNTELQKQISQNEMANRAIMMYRDKEEAERIGKQIFAREYPENADAVANFNSAKEEMISLGVEQMKKEGREVILSYLDDLDHNGINDRYETIDHTHNGADDRTEYDFK